MGRIVLTMLLFTCLFAKLQANSLDSIVVKAEIDSAKQLIFEDLESSFKSLSELYEKLRYTDQSLFKHEILRNLGIAYSYKGHTDKAIDYYHQSIFYAEKVERWDLVGITYNNLSIIYLGLKNYKEGLEFNEKAQEYAKKAGDLATQANLLESKATIYSFLGKEEESLNLYKECVKHCKEYKECSFFTLCWYGALKTSKKLGKLDEELANEKLDTTIFYNLDPDFSFYYYYLGLAQYKPDLTKVERVAYFEKALSIYRNSSSYWFMELAYTFYGNFLLSEGDYPGTLRCIEGILSREGADQYLSEDVLKLLFNYYTKIEDYEKAYKYSKQYATLKNDYFENQSKALSVRYMHSQSLAEKDRKLLASDLRIKKKKSDDLKRYLTYITNLVSLFLFIVFIVCYFIWLSAKRKKRYKNILAQKNEKLKLTDKVKSKFIDSITHELRTPLYTIMGLIELIKNADSRKEINEYLDTLDFSKNYLSTFIDQMVALNSHQEEKFRTIRYEPITLQNLIKNIILSIEVNGTDNQIILEIEPKLPSQVMGDSLKLSQILFNLINNANKFTHSGIIYIRLSLVNQTDSNITIHFEVEDTGIGIDSDKQKLVFKEFFRAETSGDKVYDGTGIGLSVVKGLVEMHGSKINLRSKKGVGTAFFFDLNFKKVSTKKVITLKSNKSVQVSENIVQNLHILLVEDNGINQMIVKKIINKKGWECSIASNGKEAVEMVSKNFYNVILMDIMMPVMNGYEATKIIREMNVKVPIIALTAVSKIENKKQFEEAGLDVIIGKPVDPDKFYDTILENVSDLVSY